MAGLTINPALVTNAAGSFSITSEGYVQGVQLDDPAARYALASGVVSSAASGPMWGGMGITDSVWTTGSQSDSIGSVLLLATSQANLTGFTVFNQANAMIQSANSPVPLAALTAGINFLRFGSGARIAVACSSAVATALVGAASNVALYWDYTNQVLLNAPGGTAIAAKLIDVNIGNSMVVSYSSGTGFGTWNRSGSTAIIQI